MNSSDKEWNQIGTVFNTLKKILLKFISTHSKRFKSMKQYEDLTPYSILSIDGFMAQKKVDTKKKSPYESPSKKNKSTPTFVNTNLLHVDRIPKEDTFLQQLKEIFEDRKYKNYTINCGDYLFPCDMFILAGRSDYFHQMFLSQMSESLTREIEVQLPRNVKETTFKTFIKYLYCDDLALPSKLDLEESMYLFE
jgi:hypothetical protein